MNKTTVAEHKNLQFVIMYIVDVDPQSVIDHLWDTSESILPTMKKSDVSFSETDSCILDPGGMLFTDVPWKKFEIDGYVFEVQLPKVSWVLRKVRRAKERIPGCRRIGMWPRNIVVSQEMHSKLIEKLEEISKSDETMHAELDDYGRKVELEKVADIKFLSIPREKYHRKDNADI